MNKDLSTRPWLLSKLGLIICIAIYIFCNYLIGIIASTPSDAPIFGFFFYDHMSLCGIISQIQIFCIICMTLYYDKLGYLCGIVLSFYTLFTNIINVFILQRVTAITGVTVTFGAILVSTIIYRYSHRLKIQMLETSRQNEMINALYREVNQIAFYDALTNLPNRRLVLSKLDELIRLHQETNVSFAVVFIDIDDFNKINDSAGHSSGDALLQSAVTRLLSRLHPQDLLGRVGGDEFALLVRHSFTSEELFIYIDELKASLKPKVIIENRKFYITASFGIALYPEHGCTSEQLLRYADLAMYAAKSKGKNTIILFNHQMQQELLHHLSIENNLTEALGREELSLVFQPQYHCQTGALRGFEVLLRWNNKELGQISPGDFIPIAESTGLIIPIGMWVLKTACLRYSELTAPHQFYPILSVNLSVVQLIEPGFVKMVEQVINETNFNPRHLEFEITESVFISSKDYAISVLQDLRNMGIHIALDDFGTAYASLSYIQSLPLDVVKIDKTFIDQILIQPKDQILVSPIITICHQLNYVVVAEGIEKQEQLDFLRAQGCDYIQGYLWGKPIPIPEVVKLLDSLRPHYCLPS